MTNPRALNPTSGIVRAGIVLAVFLLCTAYRSEAQLSAPIIPSGDFKNSVGFGVSAGAVTQRDAEFWGLTAEYGRRFATRWVAAASIAWDSETESFNTKPDKRVRSYTMVGTISYLLSTRVSLTTGLGKGFADDDNPDGSMQFNNGDLSTGIVAGFATDGFPFFFRDSISFSVAYEYNMDQKETMLSADVVFGWGF